MDAEKSPGTSQPSSAPAPLCPPMSSALSPRGSPSSPVSIMSSLNEDSLQSSAFDYHLFSPLCCGFWCLLPHTSSSPAEVTLPFSVFPNLPANAEEIPLTRHQDERVPTAATSAVQESTASGTIFPRSQGRSFTGFPGASSS